MRAKPPDENDPCLVVDVNYEPIFIAANVEDRTTAFEDARVAVLGFELGGRAPGRGLRFVKPRPQRLFGVWKVRPEVLHEAVAVDPHAPESVPDFPNPPRVPSKNALVNRERSGIQRFI